MVQGGVKTGSAKASLLKQKEKTTKKQGNKSSGKVQKQGNKSSGKVQKQKTPKTALGRATLNTKKALIKNVSASIEQEMMTKLKMEGKPLVVLEKKAKQQKNTQQQKQQKKRK